MRTTTVSLTSNGNYWQARWVCPKTGKRISKSLGSKSKVTVREARAMRARIEAQFVLEPQAASAGKCPTLTDWARQVADNRCRDRGHGTTHGIYLNTVDHLTRSIGFRRLDEIGASDVSSFLDYLRKCPGLVDGSTMSEATIRGHCRRVHTIWSDAHRAGLVFGRNPFDHLPRTTPESDRDHYVGVEDFERVLAAEPDGHWRTLFALCRYAALRKGEAQRLWWDDIDLDRRRLVVRNPEGVRTSKKRSRRVPIVPRLHKLLVEHRAASPGDEVVCGGTMHNSVRRIREAIARAGLSEWPKSYNTLRASGITDFTLRMDAPTVALVAGNSVRVIMRHYFREQDERLDRVAGVNGWESRMRAVSLVEGLTGEQCERVSEWIERNIPEVCTY